MLSQTCMAAIRSVIYLGSRYASGEKAILREIAVEVDASEHTLGKLLQTLSRQGIIKSTKGPGGGFYLGIDQLNQPIIRIVMAIDGQEIFSHCGLGLKQCSERHPCPIHFHFHKTRNSLHLLFNKKKVKELSLLYRKGFTFISDY